MGQDLGYAELFEGGSELTLEPEIKTSTGCWLNVATRPDQSILGLTADYVEAPQTEAVGAPGKHIYRFEALKEGTTSMVFRYARPFEPDQPPAREHTVKVTVR